VEWDKSPRWQQTATNSKKRRRNRCGIDGFRFFGHSGFAIIRYGIFHLHRCPLHRSSRNSLVNDYKPVAADTLRIRIPGRC
jgi:hypothetical protein